MPLRRAAPVLLALAAAWGVAGVLALARLLAARPPRVRVELAAWA